MIDYCFPRARIIAPAYHPEDGASSVELGREADGDSGKTPENQHHAGPAENPRHRFSRNYPAQSGQRTTEDIPEPEQPPRQGEEREGCNTADSKPTPFCFPPPFALAVSYLPAYSAYKEN